MRQYNYRSPIDIMRRLGALKGTIKPSFDAQYYRHLTHGAFSATNPSTCRFNLCQKFARISCKLEVDLVLSSYIHRSWNINSLDGATVEDLGDEDDELCPVDCVKEFKTDEEFLEILGKAEKTNSLVVVDFYRSSCGSCKYIEQGFAKLCKGSGVEGSPVIFLKHNVLDEYDEQSEVAERLRIRTVPLFHFYKHGVLLEAFATRDKEKILAAILKYTAPATLDA